MKKIFFFLTFLVVLLCAFQAFAQFYFNGEAKTFFSLYEGGKAEVELRFLPEVEWQISEQFRIFVEGDFRADDYSQGSIDSFSEREDRWAINLREAFAEFSGEIFNLRIGKQIFDWSVTDTVSPSDLLNPRDWRDIPLSEKVGIPAVSFKIGDSNLFGQLVYVPFFTPAKLPDGEWERDLPAGVSLADQEYDKHEGQVGFRVGGTTDGGTDWTLGYYDGLSYSPQARFDLFPAGAEIVPVYSDLEALTGSFAKEFFGSIFRAEVGWFDQEIGDDFFQYVVGVDRHWFNVLRPTDDLFFLVQYAGEKVFSYDKSVPEDWIDFRRVFNKNLMGKAIYNFSDLGVWSLEVEAAHNLSEKDGYVEASIHYNLPQFDGVEVEIGAGVPYGSQGTFWGQYGTRIFTGVSLKF